MANDDNCCDRIEEGDQSKWSMLQTRGLDPLVDFSSLQTIG